MNKFLMLAPETVKPNTLFCFRDGTTATIGNDRQIVVSEPFVLDMYAHGYTMIGLVE